MLPPYRDEKRTGFVCEATRQKPSGGNNYIHLCRKIRRNSTSGLMARGERVGGTLLDSSVGYRTPGGALFTFTRMERRPRLGTRMMAIGESFT